MLCLRCLKAVVKSTGLRLLCRLRFLGCCFLGTRLRLPWALGQRLAGLRGVAFGWCVCLAGLGGVAFACLVCVAGLLFLVGSVGCGRWFLCLSFSLPTRFCLGLASEYRVRVNDENLSVCAASYEIPHDMMLTSSCVPVLLPPCPP